MLFRFYKFNKKILRSEFLLKYNFLSPFDILALDKISIINILKLDNLSINKIDLIFSYLMFFEIITNQRPFLKKCYLGFKNLKKIHFIYIKLDFKNKFMFNFLDYLILFVVSKYKKNNKILLKSFNKKETSLFFDNFSFFFKLSNRFLFLDLGFLIKFWFKSKFFNKILFLDFFNILNIKRKFLKIKKWEIGKK